MKASELYSILKTINLTANLAPTVQGMQNQYALAKNAEGWCVGLFGPSQSHPEGEGETLIRGHNTRDTYAFLHGLLVGINRTRIAFDYEAMRKLAASRKLTAADLELTPEDKAINGRSSFHGHAARAINNLEDAHSVDAQTMADCVAHSNPLLQAVRAAKALRQHLSGFITSDYQLDLLRVANQWCAPDELTEEIYLFGQARDEAIASVNRSSVRADVMLSQRIRYMVRLAGESWHLNCVHENVLLCVVSKHFGL